MNLAKAPTTLCFAVDVDMLALCQGTTTCTFSRTWDCCTGSKVPNGGSPGCNNLLSLWGLWVRVGGDGGVICHYVQCAAARDTMHQVCCHQAVA